MFSNPHGLDNITEEDERQLAELYTVSYASQSDFVFRAKLTSIARLSSHLAPARARSFSAS